MKRNLLIIVMSVLAFSLVFVSCDNSPKTASYKVTVTAGSDYSVSNTVEQGGSVKLPAASALTVPEGQYFAWFSDGTDRYAAEEEVTNISSDLTITAVFKTIYTTGAKGEAGGWIVYDVDADNADGNDDGVTSLELGWRYLECAPELAKVTVDGNEVSQFLFGYSLKIKEVEGGESVSFKMIGTSQLLGAGKENTEKLVAAFGEETYTSYSDTSKKDKNYMAAVADKYTYTNPETKVTYSDWFLPSAAETAVTSSKIMAMYKDESTKSAVSAIANGGDVEMASSSEAYKTGYFLFDETGDGLISRERSNKCYVLPVRYI